TSIVDLLKQQSKLSYAADPGSLNSGFQSSDPRASSAWGSPSFLPSDHSLRSPLDAAEPGDNGYKQPSARASSLAPRKSFGNTDEGNVAGLPAMRPYGDGFGFGFQAPQPPPPRKSPSAPATGAGQPQKGGATLPWAKKPGAVFN